MSECRLFLLCAGSFPLLLYILEMLCRFEVGESLFIASQTPSIQDFSKTKIKQSLLSLIHIKIWIYGLLNLKNHGTQVSKQSHTAIRTCEETVFSITRFENRIQTTLIFNFSGKIFFILPCWLVIDICNTDVISFSFENKGYTTHCCNQLAGSFYNRSEIAAFAFPNVVRFRCLKIPDHSWILPCLKIRGLITDICYTDVI